MKTIILTGVLTLIASHAFAQTPDAVPPSTRDPGVLEDKLATPAGHDISAGIAGYTYREPGDQAISIHGVKFVGEYTGTLSINKQRHWFAQADVRGTVGSVTYDGWCSPFLITPNSSSPNGYELGIGAPSACTESGDNDWYLEARGLAGKDFLGRRWAWSPYTGLGLRHLSNGTTGVAGYRTDDYLYLPLGLTARTRVARQRVMSVHAEVDPLLHGWQTTRDSELGGGLIPATTTAPAFSIDRFSDVSFVQHGGWAVRAGAEFQITNRWSVVPSYIHWHVSASPVSDETATFTVNNVAAQEQFGAYEPVNDTDEFGVRLKLHF